MKWIKLNKTYIDVAKATSVTIVADDTLEIVFENPNSTLKVRVEKGNSARIFKSVIDWLEEQCLN